MERLYPQIKISEPSKDTIRQDRDLWFEIGFGGSEHLIWQARENPGVDVWGAEPFLNGAAKAVSAVDELGLTNVRLLQGDGRIVLDGLPDQALARLFVLFPDPWPKARHNKRRLITEEFLEDAYRVLKPGGVFRFASDIIDYVDWTLTRVKNHGGFSWTPKQVSDWRVRGPDWPGTRYEAKAVREGRESHYFEFIRQ
jgi:tRNA (guanine-N7-)-methyltransferase